MLAKHDDVDGLWIVADAETCKAEAESIGNLKRVWTAMAARSTGRRTMPPATLSCAAPSRSRTSGCLTGIELKCRALALGPTPLIRPRFARPPSQGEKAGLSSVGQASCAWVGRHSNASTFLPCERRWPSKAKADQGCRMEQIRSNHATLEKHSRYRPLQAQKCGTILEIRDFPTPTISTEKID